MTAQSGSRTQIVFTENFMQVLCISLIYETKVYKQFIPPAICAALAGGSRPFESWEIRRRIIDHCLGDVCIEKDSFLCL